MQTIVSISNLSKVYASGHQALNDVSLDIKKGEILALLGPNGAGKTTLISAVCGLVKPSSGTVTVDGHDIVEDCSAATLAVAADDVGSADLDQATVHQREWAIDVGIAIVG